MAEKRMSETELAKRVIRWLSEQHWDVYQEVEFRGQGGVADIVAVRDGKLWIIECKTSLTWTVLEQAEKWRAHFRSVAVPDSNSRGRTTALKVAKYYLKVGVIEVEDRVYSFPPPLMREFHKSSKFKISQLKPEHKTFCEAGSIYGHYTPYRATMDQVKKYVIAHPGCTIKEIVANLKDYHYANDKSALSCIRTALCNWEKWCRVETAGKEYKFYFNPEESYGKTL